MKCVARRPLASTRNSPSIPTLRAGPPPGGSRRYSQFPVDPHASRGATGDAGRLAPLLRPYAVDVIAKLAGVAGLDQAVNVGIESRKLLVEVARELQELDDGAVKALARNQQWNARRIRRQQNAG